MRWSQWIGLIVLVIAVYILWRIRRILLLAFTVVILATVLNCAVRGLQRLGIRKRAISIAIVLTVFILGIVPSLTDQLLELISQVPQGISRLNEWLAGWQKQFSNPILDNLWRSLDKWAQMSELTSRQMFARFFTIFSNTLSTMASILLVIVLMLMLLADPAHYRKAFARLFPASQRGRVDKVLNQCNEALGGWVVGILFNMSIIAILSGIGLWIIGFPLVIANALLAGILTFIPNVGPTLSDSSDGDRSSRYSSEIHRRTRDLHYYPTDRVESAHSPRDAKTGLSLTRHNPACAINFYSFFGLSWSIYGFTADHCFTGFASGIDY